MDNLRNTVGVIAAAQYNANPMRSEKAPIIKPTDFFPDQRRKQEPGRQTPEEQARILSMVLGVGPGKHSVN